MLYGYSTIVVDVKFDGILFRYRRLVKSGLVLQDTPGFFTIIPPANLRMLKRISIRVTTQTATLEWSDPTMLVPV